MSQILDHRGRPFLQPTKTEKKAPDTTSRGFYGYQRWNGLITEEYVAALNGGRKIDVYTKMRSDGLVEAMLAALRLPLIAATWTVERKGNDANSKKAADFVQQKLYEDLIWAEEVREMLTHLQYGFSLIVKQWAIINHEAVVSELRPLHPKTIIEGGKNWDFDTRGRVRGVWQYGTDGTKWVEEYIPATAFIHFSNDPAFADPEGRSILRAAYKHWLIVDMLYRVWAVGLERGAIGTPIGKYGPNASVEDQNALHAFVTGLVSYEEAGGTFPADTEIENYSLNIQTTDIKEAITHHKTEMAKSILAQWLMLGVDGQGGAFALSNDQTDLFILCLEAQGKYLTSRLNKSLVKDLVQYNFDTDQIPKLKITLSRSSIAALATAVRQLTAGKNPVIIPDEGIENFFRERMDLPERVGPRPPMSELVGGNDAPPPKDPTLVTDSE